MNRGRDLRAAAIAAGVGLAVIVLLAGIGLIDRANMVTSGGGARGSHPIPSQSPDRMSPLPARGAGLDRAVLDEVFGAASLDLPIDDRLVRLTRDDFLSGLRREAGREIVGGGAPPRVQFWFLVGDAPDLATAAWVEVDRNAQFPTGLYAYPTEPLADLIEIVEPDLTAADIAVLHELLRIGEGLPPPESNFTVVSRDVRYHLVSDSETTYLVATRPVH